MLFIGTNVFISQNGGAGPRGTNEQDMYLLT